VLVYSDCPHAKGFFQKLSVIRARVFKYRVIQEESAILWEMTACVILSKKVHINMGPILDGYGVKTA